MPLCWVVSTVLKAKENLGNDLGINQGHLCEEGVLSVSVMALVATGGVERVIECVFSVMEAHSSPLGGSTKLMVKTLILRAGLFCPAMTELFSHNL